MMEKIIIEGGHELNGTVVVSGAKNAAVALIPAAILADSKVTISGIPEISDIDYLSNLLKELNCDIKKENNILQIDPTNLKNTKLVKDSVDKLRASYYLMGALLGKFKRVIIRSSGGCYLGPRPIDLHLKGFEALGAEVEYKDDVYIITAKQLVLTHLN